MCPQVNTMTETQVRNWLGLYFLLITGTLGAGILLLGKSVLRLDDVAGTFQIIIPVLVGQLTIIFRWYGQDQPSVRSRAVNLPNWVVKGPPLMVLGILLLACGLKIAGFVLDAPLVAPSDDQFKNVVTFCVALLNATTIYVVSKYFGTQTPGTKPLEDKSHS